MRDDLIRFCRSKAPTFSEPQSIALLPNMAAGAWYTTGEGHSAKTPARQRLTHKTSCCTGVCVDALRMIVAAGLFRYNEAKTTKGFGRGGADSPQGGADGP